MTYTHLLQCRDITKPVIIDEQKRLHSLILPLSCRQDSDKDWANDHAASETAYIEHRIYARSLFQLDMSGHQDRLSSLDSGKYKYKQ